MSRLTPVVVAYEARDLEGALNAASAAWAEAPSEPLSELIVALGEFVGVGIDTSDWDTLVERRRAATLTPLLATAKSTAKVMKARVESLGGWPADPRIDRWVATQYEAPPFSSTGSGPFWTALKKLARKMTDPGARARLAALSSARLEGVTLASPPSRELTPDEARDAATLLSSLKVRAEPSRDQRSTAALLAEVLEHPEDLTLRRPLMDALLEEGHPRGELLALQLGRTTLTPAEKKREKALIKTHWDALLGPLAPALKPESTFVDGFLDHAEVRAAMNAAVDNALRASSGNPLWNTVRSYAGEGSVLLASPFPLLRAVETYRVRLADLTRFSKLESLTFRLQPEDVSTLSAFPALHTLALGLGVQLLPAFEAWATTRRWRSLRFHVEPNALPSYCELLTRPLALATERLELDVVRLDTSSFTARTRVVVTCAGDTTDVVARLEVGKGAAADTWAPMLAGDAAAVLDALSRRPGLKVQLQLTNAREEAVSSLTSRVRALGGTVS